MRWSDLALKPSQRVLRQFAAAWLVLFVVLAIRQGLLRGHTTTGVVLGGVALVGAVGLVKPAAVRWLFVGATVAAFPIGWTVTQVMLAVMFYVVLTPLALVFRWSRRDALQLRRRSGGASFWTVRDDLPEAERYLKQF
jgi:hypothetical protein